MSESLTAQANPEFTHGEAVLVDEQVILGDLIIHADGGPVHIAPEKAENTASGTSYNEPGSSRSRTPKPPGILSIQ